MEDQYKTFEERYNDYKDSHNKPMSYINWLMSEMDRSFERVVSLQKKMKRGGC